MTIESKAFNHQLSANKFQKEKNQTDFIRKVNMDDVACISTDLDQMVQFGGAEFTQHQGYNIRLYGRFKEEAQVLEGDQNLAPWSLGLDVIKRSSLRYRVTLNRLEFPEELAIQDDEKITL